MLLLQKGGAGYWKWSDDGETFKRCQRGDFGYRWKGDIASAPRLEIFDKHYMSGAPIAENLGDIHLEEISPAVPGIAEIEAWLEANFFFNVGGGSVSLTSSAWVDVAGSDTAGKLGQPNAPFLTIGAALDALPRSGGTVYIGVGSFTAPAQSKLISNLSLIGTQRPVKNWQITQQNATTISHTIPTALVGGTVIKGGLAFVDKSGVIIRDLGIDCGADSEVLTNCLSFYSATATRPGPKSHDIIIDNCEFLGVAGPSGYACIGIESATNVLIRDVATQFAGYGIILRCVHALVENPTCLSAATNGISIFNADSAHSEAITISNPIIYSPTYTSAVAVTEQAINVQQNSTVYALGNITICGGRIEGISRGITFATTGGSTLQKVHISGITIANCNLLAIDISTSVIESGLIADCFLSTGNNGILGQVPDGGILTVTGCHFEAFSNSSALNMAATALARLFLNNNTFSGCIVGCNFGHIDGGVYGESNGFFNCTSTVVNGNIKDFRAATNVASAWVETTGVDLYAVLGRPDKPYATIAAAIAALPSSGGAVYIGIGSFAAPGLINKNNVSLIGRKKPGKNWQITQSGDVQSYTLPSRLVGGSVIKGTVAYQDVFPVEIRNLGIDVAADFVVAGGTAGNGLSITSTNTTAPITKLQPITIADVEVLGSAGNNGFTGVLLENASDVLISNVTTGWFSNGMSVKAVRTTIQSPTFFTCFNAGILVENNETAHAESVAIINPMCIDTTYTTGSIPEMGTGILINQASTSTYTFPRVSITGGIIKSARRGVQINTASGRQTQENLITGTMFTGCASYGIECVGSTLRGLVINGCTFSSCATGIRAIAVGNNRSILITNCSIYGNTTGIEASAATGGRITLNSNDIASNVLGVNCSSSTGLVGVGNVFNANTNNIAGGIIGNIATIGVNPYTVNFTLSATDHGRILVVTAAADVTMTVPDTLPSGFHCKIRQTGVGKVIVAAGGTAVHTNFDGYTKTAGAGATMDLYFFSTGGFTTTGQMIA